MKGEIIIFGKIEVPRGANRCEFVGTTRYLTCDEERYIGSHSKLYGQPGTVGM